MSTDERGNPVPVVLWAIPAVATWLFALSTLGALAMMLLALWPPGSTGTAHIFSTDIEGITYRGFLIAYQGTPGLLLVGGQAAAVVAGLVLSALPGTPLRRVGSAVLVGWGCLWLGNAIYFTWIDAYFRSVWLAIALAIAAFLACTIAWSARRW